MDPYYLLNIKYVCTVLTYDLDFEKIDRNYLAHCLIYKYLNKTTLKETSTLAVGYNNVGTKLPVWERVHTVPFLGNSVK